MDLNNTQNNGWLKTKAFIAFFSLWCDKDRIGYSLTRTLEMVSLAELPTRLATASFRRSTNILASFKPRRDVKSSRLDTGLVVVSVSPKAYQKHVIDNKRSN